MDFDKKDYFLEKLRISDEKHKQKPLNVLINKLNNIADGKIFT